MSVVPMVAAGSTWLYRYANAHNLPIYVREVKSWSVYWSYIDNGRVCYDEHKSPLQDWDNYYKPYTYPVESLIFEVRE